MQVNTYLSFNGDCEAAFKFYEECLEGKLGQIFRYAGTPMADQVPADWQNKVMHTSLTIGEQVLMGGDTSFTSWRRMGPSWCPWRKHSGPNVLASSSIGLVYPG